MREGEFDLRLCQDRAARRVRGDGLLQRRESLRRVVKVGDGVVQSRRGQAGQQLLEPPKGPGGLKRLLRGFDGIVGARLLNKAISAPIVAFRIHVPAAPVTRRNQREHAPDRSPARPPPARQDAPSPAGCSPSGRQGS